MAAGIALTGLLLEALFRVGPPAKPPGVRRLGVLGAEGEGDLLLRRPRRAGLHEAAGPTYPPLVPILDAAAFHAMGSVDTVTFHLQYWFLVLGAVAAIAGCLHRRAPAWLLWPSLVLVLVLPRFGGRLLTPQADVLVDVLFAVGALLLVAWLTQGEAWRLVAAGAAPRGRDARRSARACSSRPRRSGSPSSRRWRGGRRVAGWLLLAALAVLAAAVPWRLWYRSHAIGGEAPDRRRRRRLVRPGGRLAPPLVRRALRLRAAGRSHRSSRSSRSSAAAVWGDRRVASYLGALLASSSSAEHGSTYSFVDIPITAEESANPIVRYTAAIVLLAVASTPLLLDSVWRGRGRAGRDPLDGATRWRRRSSSCRC